MADEAAPNTTPPEDDHVDWSSWVFTVITTCVLVLALVVSFIRYRQRKKVKRTREEEYMDRFNMILPGYNYQEMKKTTARKIMTNTHMPTSDLQWREALVSPENLSTSQEFGPTKPSTISTNILIDHRLVHSPFSRDHGGDEKSIHSLGKENVQVSYDPRHKQQPESSNRETDIGQQDKDSNISHNNAKIMFMKNNFTPKSVDFNTTEKKNYKMHSTNEGYGLNKSEPVMYTFPSPEHMPSSASNVDVNNYYIEAGLPPTKTKPKHRKHKKSAKKHNKHLDSHRPRSLPQLDDVYFGNITENNEDTTDIRHQETKPFKISSEENVSKVFVKRNPLLSDRSLRQSDTNIPLLKMNSLPEVYPFGSSGRLNAGSAFTSDHM